MKHTFNGRKILAVIYATQAVFNLSPAVKLCFIHSYSFKVKAWSSNGVYILMLNLIEQLFLFDADHLIVLYSENR